MRRLKYLAMSALEKFRMPFDRHPIAREAMIAAVAVAALGVLEDFVSEAVSGHIFWTDGSDIGGSALASLVTSSLAVALSSVVAMLLFAWLYVRGRGIDVPFRGIGHGDLRLIAVAVVLPAAIVTCADLVGAFTSTHVATVLQTYVSADSSPITSWAITGLGLVLVLPMFLIETHVLVQRPLRQVTGPVTSGIITVVLVYFVLELVGPVYGVSAGRNAALLFSGSVLAAIGIPLYAVTYVDRRWLRWLSTLPLVLLFVASLHQWVIDVHGLVGVVLDIGTLVVIAISAFGYERTDSMVPSVIAYLSFTVAQDAVVYYLEVGVGL